MINTKSEQLFTNSSIRKIHCYSLLIFLCASEDSTENQNGTLFESSQPPCDEENDEKAC